MEIVCGVSVFNDRIQAGISGTYIGALGCRLQVFIVLDDLFHTCKAVDEHVFAHAALLVLVHIGP